MDWRAAAKLMATAVSAIDQIVAAVRAKDSTDKVEAAADAIMAIGAIVETVKSGDVENLDAGKAQEELDRILKELASNDAAADAAIDAKFGASAED